MPGGMSSDSSRRAASSVVRRPIRTSWYRRLVPTAHPRRSSFCVQVEPLRSRGIADAAEGTGMDHPTSAYLATQAAPDRRAGLRGPDSRLDGMDAFVDALLRQD